VRRSTAPRTTSRRRFPRTTAPLSSPSYRPGGLGGPGDLWMTTRSNAQTAWEPARNLGAPVNSANFEITPCLSPDGLLLFFLSDRHRPDTGSIWVSRRANAASPFGPPALIQPIV